MATTTISYTHTTPSLASGKNKVSLRWFHKVAGSNPGPTRDSPPLPPAHRHHQGAHERARCSPAGNYLPLVDKSSSAAAGFRRRFYLNMLF